MAGEKVVWKLGYRPPYDWAAVLQFLAPRAVPGVELVRDGAFLRAVGLDRRRGWVRVAPAEGQHALRAEVSASLAPVLPNLVARLRRLFDLDADPEMISTHLGRDRRLAKAVTAHPGLRVPGSLIGFDAAARAILGQQISVAAATTLAGRLAVALGEPIDVPQLGLSHLAPSPEAVAAASENELTALGILRSRAATLRALGEQVARGAITFEPGTEAELVIARLLELPGVGPWTAHYVAMRGLGWPDAFPDGDLGVLRALGNVSAREARAIAERWRPWRAYAVMHLWNAHSAGRAPPPRSTLLATERRK
jgi:AraC family transcriptional regulator of adaptative response / DNA-3-methyladenine glycosylase II